MGAVSGGIDPITNKHVRNLDRWAKEARDFVERYDEWLMTMIVAFGERPIDFNHNPAAVTPVNILEHAFRCGHIEDECITQKARDYLSQK